MISRIVTLPELGLIAGTRVALGVGAGLLLAGRLGPESRRAAGWALLGFGALSTIPLAVGLLRGRRLAEPETLHVASGAPGRFESAWEERTPASEL